MHLNITFDTPPIRISPSRLSVFQDCPKKFHLSYVTGLRKKESRLAFDLGNYGHELLHVYYQTLQVSPGMNRDLLSASIQARIQNDVRQAKPEHLPVYNKIRKHVTRFIEKQSKVIDRGIKVLGVELEYDVPVTLPSGRKINLYGFIDLVYRTLRGQLVVRDHKFSSNVRRYTEENTKWDLQLLSYGAVIYLLFGEAPSVEHNVINTYEYKNAPTENEFKLLPAGHSEKVYKNFLEETYRLIDEMLDSKPTPHYSSACSSCQFKDICDMELKGVSTVNLIKANYERIDPNAPKRPPAFTENYATSDEISC